MTSLTSTLFLSLIFHQAFCCLGPGPLHPPPGPGSFQTKETFCASLDSPTALLGSSIASNLTEFCQSDSVGEAGNR